jgi:hypothetical protein
MKTMAKSSNSIRAPRGTKILAKAFFDAADEIPEPQRAEVVKAALALIRDELKAAREKVAAAKAKAKDKAGRRSAGSVRKSPLVAKAPTKSPKKAASVRFKAPAKRARKVASKTTEPATPDEPAAATQSDS